MAGTGSEFYEVWEDTVSMRDLVMSLVITVSLTMIGYLAAPDDEPLPLVLGLAGAIVGFTISVFLCRPKRSLETKMADEESSFQDELEEDN